MSIRDQVLKSVKNLPPAPDVAWRVMRTVRDPDYEADDLLRAVELDPSVTSLLLKTVNSSLENWMSKLEVRAISAAQLGTSVVGLRHLS